MLFSIGTMSTFFAIWFTWIKIKPNENLKQHKTGVKLNAISTIYVLKFVKSFIIYYIKYVCLRIWVSKVYVQELKWESMKKVLTKNT
jgi:hypothetical protein